MKSYNGKRLKKRKVIYKLVYKNYIIHNSRYLKIVLILATVS